MSESETGVSLVIREDGSVVGEETLALDTIELSMAQLSDLGIIAPIATPQILRQAFAYKQRLYAAILDPADYIYTVSYKEGNKTRQYVSAVRSDAQKVAETHRVPLTAKPKKSGIVKLADALGIEAECVQRQGLPSDPAANFSYVVYEAVHRRSGRKAEGVGWCDTTERGGYIGRHDVIATADTRAFNRAVLRLSGFGDVSADEIIAGASGDEDLPNFVPEVQSFKPAALLPPTSEDHVITASRAWATACLDREDGFLPPAQQAHKAFRELRARARRGDGRAAQQMGVMGIRWEGSAQDGPGYESFTVEVPPVGPEDVALVRAAGEGGPKPEPRSNGEKSGWDLSSQGSAQDDARGETEERAEEREHEFATDIPLPQADRETITTAQAKSASKLLMEVFADKDAARAWLKRKAHVERSSQVRTNQYEKLVDAITKMKKEVPGA